MGSKVNAPQLGHKPKRSYDERKAWVMKDEGLRAWWDRSMKPISLFIQDNREEIDRQIDLLVNQKG